MPTIEVPEETYRRLSRRAANRHTTIESLAVPVLEQLSREAEPGAAPLTPPGDLPYDEWKKRFDDLLSLAHSRSHLYPPGFEADVSRESIYEGCGE